MSTPITELVETTSSPLTSMYRLIRTYVSLAEEETIAFDSVLQFRCQRSFERMNSRRTQARAEPRAQPERPRCAQTCHTADSSSRDRTSLPPHMPSGQFNPTSLACAVLSPTPGGFTKPNTLALGDSS